MIRNRFQICIIGIVLVLALSSCSSSKKTVVTVPGHTQEIVFRPKPVDEESVDDNRMAALISEARKWLGTKYVYGGHSLNGTDCSGMVMELYLKMFDIKLPRSCREQQQYCSSVDRNSLRVGDLLFFASSKSSRAVSHVGLYIGNDEMIHASSSRGVIVSNITDKYYTSMYHSSGRVVSTGTKKPKSKRDQRQMGVKRSGTVGIPSDVPEIKLEDLINAKIDSIYSSYPPES